MDFVAEFDAAGPSLPLSGDCRMVDAPALGQAIGSVMDAAPPTLAIDLTRAGELKGTTARQLRLFLSHGRRSYLPQRMTTAKGDRKVLRAWTMYDWANSSYSLTITSAIFPMFYVAVTKAFGDDRFIEAYGVPSASLYSYALSAGFLLVALIVPLLSGIADHRGNKLNSLKLFCYVGSSACAGLFFFSVEHVWIGMACIVRLRWLLGELGVL